MAPRVVAGFSQVKVLRADAVEELLEAGVELRRHPDERVLERGHKVWRAVVISSTRPVRLIVRTA